MSNSVTSHMYIYKYDHDIHDHIRLHLTKFLFGEY